MTAPPVDPTSKLVPDRPAAADSLTIGRRAVISGAAGTAGKPGALVATNGDGFPQPSRHPADKKIVKCPNCSAEIPSGVTKCECGYDYVAASTGRPRMSESMALPESPLMGRGMNFNMSFGVLLCLLAITFAVANYHGILGNFPRAYWVSAGIFAMGVLRYLRGCAQCRAD